jgi:hypothetical protein
MTEALWRSSGDSQRMSFFIWNKYQRARKESRRKMRLFACACCRRAQYLLTDPRSRDALDLGEQFADGRITPQASRRAQSAAQAAYKIALAAVEEANRASIGRNAYEAVFAPMEAASAATQVFNTDGGTAAANAADAIAHAALARPKAPTTSKAHEAARKAEDKAQAVILRDLFGNPFRPTGFDPAWRTATVVRLAQALYDERRFEDLPILADALEEAGCTHAELLDHLRGRGRMFSAAGRSMAFWGRSRLSNQPRFEDP